MAENKIEESKNEMTLDLSWKQIDPNLIFRDNYYENNDIKDISGHEQQLTLTRARCVNPTLVNSFLNILRHKSDDIIRQRLNDYEKIVNTGKSGSSEISKLGKCGYFLEKELYPNWEVRRQAIQFCENESIKMEKELENSSKNSDVSSKSVVEARLDPYASRDRQAEENSRYNELNSVKLWIKNNKKIESILKNTANEILRQRCDQNTDYINKFWTFSNNQH
ncbi:hypothetical protein TPHA_0B01510 [Tetrapisispora phaffii CBS 4417]|uniref:Mitochondrial intermembrane space cysteine motif-containing protein MIX23 n=1 Tax=Tetrapisispora phaffii (strain ATCC 24235 / CBS 4417 / NBRC 1672 / NRRL Y-8282 / UCD 70-5) TaxID=1071381 RepID=G8BP93_TETPH|nr:hypothetical protein TPHA_0B01510 [Tetrapisispora phaffii CBS 4417]CCE61824.1 hypothetical protein TPHA_0B01510 [Tetrapisispora phaffii CBS 4417]